jgi:uncharacterized membrane protein YfbV (UPF0208 family)
VSHSLGRLFAACFGCIALSATIILGLLSNDIADAILTRALKASIAFTAVGWVIGQIADTVVRKSVEMNYRERFEKLRERRKKEAME